MGETLSRGQFQRRLAEVKESLFPSRDQYVEDNSGILIADPLLRELARRERANRVGLLASIIHLHMMSPLGYEVSGYVDYADRLAKENWKPYFSGERRLCPARGPARPDLSFYHWRMDQASCKSSTNFKVVPDPRRGLLFKHRKDRLRLCVDPAAAPGPNSTRTRVSSPQYLSCVIYDHVVRQKC